MLRAPMRSLLRWRSRMAGGHVPVSAGGAEIRSRAKMDSAEPSRPLSPRKNGEDQSSASYRLDDQVGFLLRRVTQRHVAIFAAKMGEDITPMRWAVLAKLHEAGPSSQNRLGRSTAMDGATIKGVVDRLMGRGLIETRPDPLDARRRVIGLT